MATEAVTLNMDLAREHARGKNNEATRTYTVEITREYSKTLMDKAHKVSKELPGVDRNLWPNLLWVRFHEIIDEYHDMLKKAGIIA